MSNAYRQRAFAEALVLGGGNGSQAARIAGYTGDAASIKATASRLKKDPRVQSMVQEIALTRLSNGAAIGVECLEKIAKDPAWPMTLRLRAAESLIALYAKFSLDPPPVVG